MNYETFFNHVNFSKPYRITTSTFISLFCAENKFRKYTLNKKLYEKHINCNQTFIIIQNKLKGTKNENKTQTLT